MKVIVRYQLVYEGEGSRSERTFECDDWHQYKDRNCIELVVNEVTRYIISLFNVRDIEIVEG